MKPWFPLTLLALLTTLSGCATYGFHASYANLSLEDRLTEADAIVVGVVQKISPTRWNQDSGERWEVQDRTTSRTALPLYTITLAVKDRLATTRPVGRNLTLTILGISPLDQPDLSKQRLFEGDEVVIMARYTDLAWRDGVRPVWKLMGDPEASYFLKVSDQQYQIPNAKETFTLDRLVAEARQLRAE